MRPASSRGRALAAVNVLAAAIALFALFPSAAHAQGPFNFTFPNPFGSLFQPQSAPASGPATAIKVTEDPWYGDILTDGNGRALYRLEPDVEGGVTDCLDSSGCTSEWPPLIVAATPPRPPGLPGQLTTRRRPDGRLQLVYNGWPLYLNREDTEPGDAFGHRVTDQWGSWSVVSPDDDPPEPPPTS